MTIIINTDVKPDKVQETANNNVWDNLNRDFRRTQKFLEWMINGQFQHGISPMKFSNLTPERVEELYNVNFGD